MVTVVVGKAGRGLLGWSWMWLALVGCAPALGPVPDAKTAHASASSQLGSVSALRGALFRYRFAVYVPERPGVAVAELVAKAARARGFQLVDESPTAALPPRVTSVTFAEPPIEKLAPPTAQHMQYFSKGLSAEEQRSLAACRYVTMLEVVGPGDRAFADYREALVMQRELAQALGGYLWDEEMRIAYSVQSSAARSQGWASGAPFVNDHISLHVYRDGDLMRLVSLGMVKLGLPDVAVSRVPETSSTRMAKLLDLVLQRLAEGAAPDASGKLLASLDDVAEPQAKAWLSEDVEPNAKRSVTLSLVEAHVEQGDADNRLLELEFPGDESRLQERQAEALAEVFGSEDKVMSLRHDDALLAASERARRRALKLQPRYAKQPPFGEQLLVKAPFATQSGDNEWMWLEVVRWPGDTIEGVLVNDAFDVPGLRVGTRVQVRAEEIFDYLLKRRDGTFEGNDTEKLLEARARAVTTKP